MTILESVRSWLSDPFGRKKQSEKHEDIQRDMHVLRGQVTQKTRDLSRHPYRSLHRDFRQKEREADVRVHE